MSGGRLDKAFIDYIGIRAIRGADGTPGPTGPTGPTGPPGPTETNIGGFFYDSTSPFIVQSLPVGIVVNRVSVSVNTVFNSPATVKIGTFANPNLFFDLGDINLNQSGSYDNQQIYISSVSDFLVVFFSSPGATQGYASIIVKTG